MQALLALAVQAGLPMVTAALQDRLGDGGRLAGEIVARVASRTGIAPDGIEAMADKTPGALIEALRDVEKTAPELVQVYLAEVQAAAQKAIDACRSVGVGLAPCTLPAVGQPNFTIAPGTMEVGIGHHGEPGMRVEALRPAQDIADDMLRIVMAEHDLPSGATVAVLLSGLGATPVNELYVLYGRVEAGLAARGLRVHRALVGNYFTSLDMVGVTLTVIALFDVLAGFSVAMRSASRNINVS